MDFLDSSGGDPGSGARLVFRTREIRVSVVRDLTERRCMEAEINTDRPGATFRVILPTGEGAE